jgi:hypothetical protein
VKLGPPGPSFQTYQDSVLPLFSDPLEPTDTNTSR